MGLESDYEVGGDLSGGSFINAKGNYHLCVTEYIEVPVKADGTPYNATKFGIRVEVLASTVPGQEGKTGVFRFGEPLPSNRDGGAFLRKIIDRFIRAVGFITDADAGKRVSFNPAEMVGRHFMASVDLEAGDNGKEYPRFNGAEIYHVDDPQVLVWPKDKSAMALPAAWRRVSAKPPAKDAVANHGTAAAPAASPAAATPATPAPAAAAAPATPSFASTL